MCRLQHQRLPGMDLQLTLLPPALPLHLVAPNTHRQMGDAAFRASKFDLARRLLAGTIQGQQYADFLTNLCYDHIVTPAGPRM